MKYHIRRIYTPPNPHFSLPILSTHSYFSFIFTSNKPFAFKVPFTRQIICLYQFTETGNTSELHSNFYVI
ncbi:hypothetical protein HanRHA438_Chr09g0394181 [Helianthus annuus]|uniref:Uncharacterized protein n=1 Tax=Helianthus annuus TaxID=4232 RepID=A0A251TVK4_HELAN|nr:hypothetical protein HanXRQr2_Chr09g0382621 [Helianthus annuus]KAJ0533792.1 hypothetical protein HanIR_Chr09g0412441 [Helianthus annuus]KAJ0887729.1 hypothetical protein HanRHA438_Chr09g0394181 [Helianthus annuus]KAJ0892670.1 hypothetical protein HanPSC8_Chr09g0368651 [Helianthus annuus]